jgi:hypothetical protein
MPIGVRVNGYVSPKLPVNVPQPSACEEARRCDSLISLCPTPFDVTFEGIPPPYVSSDTPMLAYTMHWPIIRIWGWKVKRTPNN